VNLWPVERHCCDRPFSLDYQLPGRRLFLRQGYSSPSSDRACIREPS
jgi:hypothetical protein